jgi:hypothetical protein
VPPTPAEQHLARVKGGYASWANTPDRTARTAPGRAAFEQRFLDQADGDPKRAEALRRAHFADLALKSARGRRLAREYAAQADAAEAELDAGDAA